MECSELLIFIGKRIRHLRKGRKMSQERLAELAGLHPTSISDIELGKVNAFICNYFNLAKALGVSLADLFDASADFDEVESSWEELAALVDQIRNLDRRKRAVYLDAAGKLFERVDSI
jgi:transcriptional regulator with XRE-family HTH domain